jgi:hypothetical protein
MDDFQGYLLQTYGPAVAQRYAKVRQNYQPPDTTPIRTERWISNRIHRDKSFTPVQAATIRSQYSAGQSCRDLARYWGVSQGLISQVIARRGSYR